MEKTKKKPRVKVKITKSSYAFNPPDHDMNSRFLIGWPGYRTRSNKSGLGYVDTAAELAHMEGVMIRWLMTGRFRTHNPIYLIFMAFYGIFYGGIPAILTFHEVFIVGRSELLPLLIGLFPQIAIGLLVLINLCLSIVDRKGKSITGD